MVTWKKVPWGQILVIIFVVAIVLGLTKILSDSSDSVKEARATQQVTSDNMISVGTVDGHEVFKFEDGDPPHTCYIVLNQQWATSSPAISCLK